MASIKVVIRKRQNAQGQHPIIIRISKNRKSSILSIGQSVEEKHWDADRQRVKKSHPNSVRLNNFILKKLTEANDKLLELEGEKRAISAQNVTKQIKPNNSITTFFELARVYLDQLESQKQLNRLSGDKPRIRHFKDFLKGRDITFPEITEVLLRQFQGYLRSEIGNSERSVANTLIVLRTIFNLAIREGIVDRKYYPFGRGGVVIRFPQSVKIGLSTEEVLMLENAELDRKQHIHARNVWLLSFYFAGMRISDTFKLQWSDFRDGRLYYKMGKNRKVLSLKVPEKAKRILEYYEPKKRFENDFVFPELKKADSSVHDIRRKIRTGNKKINNYLKQIADEIGLDKPLTMHIARHSFGNISGDRIPVQVLQRLYRHSDITTTINYQGNFTHREVDDALEKVLDM